MLRYAPHLCSSPGRVSRLIPLCCLLLVAAAASAASPTCAASPEVDTVHAVVDPSVSVSPPVASNYVSFSLESFFLRAWFGSVDNDEPRPSFVRLVNQLRLTAGRTGPTFRIGGWSVDESYYQPGALPDPPLSQYPGPAWRYNITAADLLMLRNTMTAVNSTLVIGLNIRGDTRDAVLAVNYTAAIAAIVGWERVWGLEVGNEQDGYGGSGIRPHNYSYADYAVDFQQTHRALLKAVPALPPRVFQAGAYASADWDTTLPSLVSAYPGTFTNAALHFYPTTHCGGNVVTVEQLLSDDFATREARYVQDNKLVQRLQDADGVGLVVGEGNSASCFGAPGVSNSFASALWTLDSLFHTAAVGLKGWAFTVGGVWGGDTPYHIPVTDAAWQYTSYASDGRLVVEPMYYAMRMFAMATANDSALISSRVVNSSNAMIRLWAAASASQLSIVSLHKDINATQPAELSVCVRGAELPPAALIRLTAANASSEFGVRLAGQTYDGSEDGGPVGDWHETMLKPERGCYSYRLLPLSATLLSIARAVAVPQ